MIKQAKFTYSTLGKALEKQIKTIEDQGTKQIEALKILKPTEHKQKIKSIETIFQEVLENNEIKSELRN